MSKRILTAAIVLGIFLPTYFLLSSDAWRWINAILAGACLNEWGRLSGLKKLTAAALALIGCVIAYLMLSEDFPAQWLHVLAGIVWLTILGRIILSKNVDFSPLPKVAGGLIAILSAIVAFHNLRATDSWQLLLVMATIWVSDSAAYFTGRLWGKTKLAPNISPGKTWEGVAGAMIAVFAYGVILALLAPSKLPYPWLPVELSLIVIPLCLLLLAAVGIIGDLTESLFKRIAGVKDSGAILPGHGGLLDRLDALLPVLPLLALVSR